MFIVKVGKRKKGKRLSSTTWRKIIQKEQTEGKSNLFSLRPSLCTNLGVLGAMIHNKNQRDLEKIRLSHRFCFKVWKLASAVEDVHISNYPTVISDIVYANDTSSYIANVYGMKTNFTLPKQTPNWKINLHLPQSKHRLITGLPASVLAPANTARVKYRGKSYYSSTGNQPRLPISDKSQNPYSDT
jgi:hypothetical protein